MNNLKSLEETLNKYFGQQAPALPNNVKEAIVKYSPWIILILLLISLPALLFFLGVGTFLIPFSYAGGISTGMNYTVAMVVSITSLVLEALAIPGLMKRTKQGWNLVFYSTLVGMVANLISLNIIGMLIGAAISFYILFQVRSYYK